MGKRWSRIVSLFRRPADWPVQESVIGMAWYAEHQWARLREVSVDGERLEKTYDEWQRLAQNRFDELIKKERRVVKVPVDVEDLAAWCREMGRVVDAEGRVAYVKNRITQSQLGNLDKL